MERFLFRIEILPPQCTDLAPAQTCGNCGIEEIVPEFILFDGRHESVQLCFGQDFHGRAVKLGRVNFCRGIVGDQVLLHSRFHGVVRVCGCRGPLPAERPGDCPSLGCTRPVSCKER